MGRPSKAKARFAVCVRNKGYEASLGIGKLYRVIPDATAERHGYLRIVEESGEDYGYAAARFFVIDVPRPLERILLMAASGPDTALEQQPALLDAAPCAPEVESGA